MALPITRGSAAIEAIEGLARDHPHVAHHIHELGTAFLRRANGLYAVEGGYRRHRMVRSLTLPQSRDDQQQPGIRG